MINLLAPLACPIDGLPLSNFGKTWQCGSNHHFDLSRHGYLNLLPASQKTSRDPGDSKEMVQARRHVMATGIFETFAKELGTQVYSRATGTATEPVVLDAGCGEGYYTEIMRQSTPPESTGPEPIYIGLDVSKWAIQAAARRYPDISWLVGNNKRLPVLPGSLNVITTLFGFETWHPWSALQSTGQHVLVAHAGPRHLIEMRELIYESVAIHAAADDRQAIEAGYQKVEESTVSYNALVDSLETANKILSMTPHGYRIAPQKKANLQEGLTKLVSQSLTIDVMLRWYQLSSSPSAT